MAEALLATLRALKVGGFEQTFEAQYTQALGGKIAEAQSISDFIARYAHRASSVLNPANRLDTCIDLCGSNEIMSPRTKQNLAAAMQCDALDAAKYARFAARARMDDDWELAKAFQETADTERTEHFSKEAELEGLIAKSPDNLRNTIDEETKEIERFTEFARQATEDGDLGIASVFEQISHDKAERRVRFEAVLADMGLHSNPQTVKA